MPSASVRKYLLPLLLITVLTSPSPSARAEEDEDVISVATVGDYRYDVSISGAPQESGKSLLALTDAQQKNDSPPPTLYLLQRRLDRDAETLTKALQAMGYYDASVTTSLEAEEKPYQAHFSIVPGEVYILESVRVLLDPRSETEKVVLPEAGELGIPIGGAVDYAAILNARTTVRDAVHKANCLRSVRVRPFLRIDTSGKEAEAIYRVRTGKEARFGPVTVEGLETVQQSYIDRKLPWKQGECYKPSHIEDLQVKLLQTNLFSTSEITVAEESDENGEFPVKITLRERAHRTIKAGIGYATEEGLDFRPAWEHRNFFGEGEKLTIDSTLSNFMQSLHGKLERPDFLRNSQTLVLESELAQAETDAYDSTSLSASAQLTRPLAKNLTGGLGVAYALKRVKEDGLNQSEDTFSLVSLPSFLEHSTRNSIIDPTKGHLLRLDVEPFVETLNNGATFVKTQGSARFYHQHSTVPLEPTWAFRAIVGSIVGSSSANIPADERFYSGGGGSVRGYAFQSLGPLTDGNPDGGRSVVEFSAELRLRVTESFGVVPFVDAGNVYSEPYPEFQDDLFYAAGLGFRYFSDFGPFRLDIATPLNRRDSDDSFQLYISFGQAF